MSGKGLAQEVANLLKTNVEAAAKGAADLRMKDLSVIVQKEMEGLPGIVQKEMEGLPGIVRQEMDACLDGKCDDIAAKVIEKFPEFPKLEASTLKVEDVTKAVMDALAEGSKTPFTVEGHTAHDILDCPTCKPIIVDKLWENEEYRQTMAEKVCEDEECRNLFLKHFEKKGYEGIEAGRKEETWAERRLRERSERKPG